MTKARFLRHCAYGLIKPMNLFSLALCMAGLLACGQHGVSGSQTRLRVAIGQIKEVTLSAPADSTHQLVGTSDNSEIVEVSLKEAVSAQTGAVKSPSNTFLIKGVTAGTARVVFTENQTHTPGPGPIRKAYSVQVTTQ